MSTDPGDLVFDPTCGSGTTAYVAEQWGRRWITCDTSRVPLALARQRLLTATYPWYDLKEPERGPAGGFVYERRQNRKGEEVGGLVPHITLKSIANGEEPRMEVLVDRPEVVRAITRVTGPFTVEGTIPAPAELPSTGDVQPVPTGDSAETPSSAQVGDVSPPVYHHGDPEAHVERMIEVLRRSKTLRLPGNEALHLADIRRVSDAEHLHAEATAEGGATVAVAFGPEDGAVSSQLVFEAASEARFLRYEHLYVFGFAIQAKAREMVGDRRRLRLPCTYVTVTPDVVMSDLLKTNRSSEIFSVTGLPDIEVRPAATGAGDSGRLWEVELLGLDVFHPVDMTTEAIEGRNLPAWMLDTDYNGLCFYASQVFFPRTAAWDNLRRALGASYDDAVWEHLAGTLSEPFPEGSYRRIAVKVIDERGNELMVVRELPA